MTSMTVFCSFLLASSITADAQTLEFITNNFAPTVEWQDPQQSKSLPSTQAKIQLRTFCEKMGDYKINQVHDAKLNSANSTYGIVHIENESTTYRVFYLCERQGQSHKIVKIRITKA